MFKPSTAPRWKIATRIFLRTSVESAAYSDRDSHTGMDPTPNIASAEPFKNTRLDGILLLPLTSFENPATQSLTRPPAPGSSAYLLESCRWPRAFEATWHETSGP